ncbi:hypothetical protein KR074_011978 [Drosophila pseudoananassae]|nr:hypothetical protein KR074_011978 [Drosophila pseudoananassae]
MMSKENPSNPKDAELSIKRERSESEESRDAERILAAGLIRLKKRNRETIKALKQTHSSVMKQQDKILIKLNDEVQGSLVTPRSLRALAQFQVLQNDLSSMKWDKGEDLDRLGKTLEEVTLSNGNNSIIETFRLHYKFRKRLVKMHNFYSTHHRAFQQKMLDYAKKIRQPLPPGAPPRPAKGA